MSAKIKSALAVACLQFIAYASLESLNNPLLQATVVSLAFSHHEGN
jgi:hypothetical protein